LGLRGVGKTALLNHYEEWARTHHHVTTLIEAPEEKPLVELLFPKILQVLRKLSLSDQAKPAVHSAMRALRSLAAVFKIKIGDVSISVDPEEGTADSGHLEDDLADVFVRAGDAAKAAGRAWTLLVDEVQYLSKRDLSALIISLHKNNQRTLPVLFFGAGLPQIAELAADAKSYAELLFSFPQIGPLDPSSAANAIRQPIESEGETIDPSALRAIVDKTQGYPYFLQEWGYQVWNLAEASPFDAKIVDAASAAAIRKLDESFFRVRFDLLTPKEREYVMAMAQLGPGPYRFSDVAAKLNEPIQSLGPRRASIIRKGMIYSPSYGDIAFTVPTFDEFLND
jgi:AAA domain